MREQNYTRAYIKALWEKPITLALTLLDIAGLIAIILVVIDESIK